MKRRLDTAHVFERVFAIYGSHAWVLLGVALVVYVLAAILTAALLSPGITFGGLVLALTVILVSSFVYNAMVVELVRDVQDGRLDQSVRAMLRSVTPALAPLLGASLIAGIGITLGLMLFVIPGLVLVAWWALVAPVIIVERTGALASLGRSRELVRGNAWRVFGVLVVILAVTFFATSVLGSLSEEVFLAGVLSLASQVLLAPLFALATAQMYFELKAIEADAASPAMEMPSGV